MPGKYFGFSCFSSIVLANTGSRTHMLTRSTQKSNRSQLRAIFSAMADPQLPLPMTHTFSLFDNELIVYFSSSFSSFSFSSSSYVLLSCCGFAQSHTSNKWKDGVFVDFWIHTKKNLVGRPTLSKHVPYSKRSYSSLIMSLLKMVSCLFRDMSLTPNGIIRA